jgi:2,4-dienoyl-CoA reductase-like NADH-dependent reductase (Old Yellow Enzyme family)
MIHRDDFIPDYRRVTESVHRLGTPVILQIQHCGRQTTRQAAGERPVAPSPLRDGFYSEEVPRELREEEIIRIIESFIRAVGRAAESGFDGVQLHAAYGYLLSEFLSPRANRRTDRWGGTLGNRFRIIREILEGARRQFGSYPVLVKLNASDAGRGGMRLDESMAISSLLQESGCAGIEVGCGTFADGLNSVRGPELPLDAAFEFIPKYRRFSPIKKGLFRVVAPLIIKRHRPYRNYNVDAASAIRSRVSIPVIVVGGITGIRDIEDIITGGKADFAAMSRPFIIEPDIVDKFKSGTRAVSRCIMCNYCSIGLMVAPLKCYYRKLPQHREEHAV